MQPKDGIERISKLTNVPIFIVHERKVEGQSKLKVAVKHNITWKRPTKILTLFLRKRGQSGASCCVRLFGRGGGRGKRQRGGDSHKLKCMLDTFGIVLLINGLFVGRPLVNTRATSHTFRKI